MEKEKEIVENLKKLLKEGLLEAKIPRERRILVCIRRTVLMEAVNHLVNDLEFKHLSTITGVDLGEEVEVIYHLAYEGSIELSLKLTVPRENPTIPTIADVIPGALLYEREVHDLLGVTFEGHPDLSPLVLPEGWPEGVYPLRKEHDLEKLQELLKPKGDEQADG